MLVLSEVIEQVAARMRFVISPKGFDSDLAGYEDFGDFGFLWKNGQDYLMASWEKFLNL